MMATPVGVVGLGRDALHIRTSTMECGARAEGSRAGLAHATR